MRGTNKPFWVLFTSSSALAFAELPSVLMARDCAAERVLKKTENTRRESSYRFILVVCIYEENKNTWFSQL